jgi:L-2-hydroxyglutarate oxidase
VPEIREEHLEEAPAGVRAMALSREGEILDDFYFVSGDGDVHVLNAPSPAATSALSLANEIVRFTKEKLSL